MSLLKTGAIPREGAIGTIALLKTEESNFINHVFVQFRNQHIETSSD